MKIKLKILVLVLGYLSSSLGVAQSSIPNKEGSLKFKQFQTDELYNSQQLISILSLPLSYNENYSIDMVFSETELKKTSSFAKEANAVASINAGFFNMKLGGSVTYLEIEDSLVTASGPKELLDSLWNGVVILNKDNTINIEIKKPDSIYLKSKLEKSIICTGPVLILDGKKVSMPDMKFVDNRHPRTCLCKTADSLMLITIDGRSSNANGMNLYELQDFLLSKKCLESINFDGGGSTTMWVRDKGVVNQPSDKTGERNVANALVITEKK